jgi:hypothetical protein
MIDQIRVWVTNDPWPAIMVGWLVIAYLIYRPRRGALGMLLGDELRNAVQRAYEESRQHAAKENHRMPKWEALPLAMRVAFLHVFSAGRNVVAKEERERDLPR